jgi:Tat protein translocase TatB subunit
MFNIGPPELIVIFLVALLVVGPRRLPQLGKSIGKGLRELRQATSDFRSSMDDDDDEDEVVDVGSGDKSASSRTEDKQAE